MLVVDDSAMNRDLVERALALEGASTTLAADGQQALQLLRTRPEGFDAVLMDVQMQVMDGLSAMRVIRGELGITELPIIAFTAGVSHDQQTAAREAGANDVLPKPMDLDDMAVLLARWVRPRVAEGCAHAAGEAGMAIAAQGAGGAMLPAIDKDAFPDIPGIDRDRALQRVGQDRAMFIGLLDFFIEDNADAVQQARSELAAGEREAAARRMHTLRSNAGFICAMELMEAAGALEVAIEQDEPDVEARLAELEQGIAALIEAIAPWR